MTLTLTKLSDHTGVEATGVDLTKPVDADTRARLNQAFHVGPAWLTAPGAVKLGRQRV